jgi:hypothetical protein
VLSAATWAVAVVAYPPLLAPLAVLVLGVAVCVRPGRRFLGSYLLWLAAGQLLAWSAVFALLSPRTIARSVDFQARVNAIFDAHATVVRIREVFTQNGWFTAMLVAIFVLGVLRARIPAVIGAIAEALLILGLFLPPPALFSTAHGAVLLVALGGVPLLAGLLRGQDTTWRLLSVLYATSWVTGFAMAGTAMVGHFKVPVGAVLAAIIALLSAAGRCRVAGHPRFAPLPATALWAVLVVSLFQTYYGELPQLPSKGRVRLTHGPFAGLAAAVVDANLIEIAERLLREQQRPGDTLVVLGRLPGIYLLADAPIRAFAPYTLANRPSLVLAYKDPYFPFINPFGPDFEKWYAQKASLPTPLGRLEVYRRRD